MGIDDIVKILDINSMIEYKDGIYAPVKKENSTSYEELNDNYTPIMNVLKPYNLALISKTENGFIILNEFLTFRFLVDIPNFHRIENRVPPKEQLAKHEKIILQYGSTYSLIEYCELKKREEKNK